MKILFEILLFVPVAYLTISSLYQLVLAIASRTKSRKTQKSNYDFARFLILVPAYKEDAIIQYSAAKNLLAKYEYPKHRYDFVVIADQLKDATKAALKNEGAMVHSVSFDKSTKVKSLQSAVAKYNKGYDAVIVLDADNVMEKGFLFKANQLFQSGYRSIQGLRKAANSNTSTAVMDGLSETANTEMLCKGANRLGLSSKLSGSAMVFEFELFKTIINQCEAIGGFDKEMELLLTQRKEFIHYSSELAVLDQKVTSTEAFTKQRGRWIEAQYSFFKKSFKESFVQLWKGNFDYFHKVMQLALPPRAIAPFAIAMAILVGVLMSSQVLTVGSLVALTSLIIAYLLVLPLKSLYKQSIKIGLSIPRIGLAALKALLLMRKSRSEFIHTKHEIIEG